MILKSVIVLSAIILSACGSSRTYLHHFNAPIQPKVAFITENSPTLPPFGYVQFCNDNPQECKTQINGNNITKFSGMNGLEVTSATQTNSISDFDANNNQQEFTRPPQRANAQFATIISLLENVNSEVNDNVIQVTDMNGFGVQEKWRIPKLNSFVSDIGDCEDFALAKRKILIEKYGFNPNALAMSVLRRPQGDIHAVLMVRTSYGDYVLDNLEENVLAWNDTGYHWMKKQAFGNSSKWVSL